MLQFFSFFWWLYLPLAIESIITFSNSRIHVQFNCWYFYFIFTFSFWIIQDTIHARFLQLNSLPTWQCRVLYYVYAVLYVCLCRYKHFTFIFLPVCLHIRKTSLMMSQTYYNVYIPWGTLFLQCKIVTVNDVNANNVSSPTFNEPWYMYVTSERERERGYWIPPILFWILKI